MWRSETSPIAKLAARKAHTHTDHYDPVAPAGFSTAVRIFPAAPELLSRSRLRTSLRNLLLTNALSTNPVALRVGTELDRLLQFCSPRGIFMTIRSTLGAAFVGGALLLTGNPVWAHHSLVSQFSLDKPITLRGTVTRLVWLNPHGRIYVAVKGDDGQTENWMVETGATSRMIRRGLKKTDFPFGTEVIVSGYAARDGQRKVAGMIVTFPAREAASPPQEASFSLGR
jgi:hypothetical protein